TRLRQANGMRVNGEEDEIARQMAASLATPEGKGGLTLVRTATPAAALGQPDPVRAPMPPQRVASAAAGGVGASPAPTRAPAAPRRPG
ncbi:MAG: hypothetical protein ACE5EU_09545, partial [Paracoccaceae bacterium]